MEKEMNSSKLETLEKLVEELMKDQPEEQVVESYMKVTGLEYTSDPIQRINTVLKMLHFEETE